MPESSGLYLIAHSLLTLLFLWPVVDVKMKLNLKVFEVMVKEEKREVLRFLSSLFLFPYLCFYLLVMKLLMNQYPDPSKELCEEMLEERERPHCVPSAEAYTKPPEWFQKSGSGSLFCLWIEGTRWFAF